MIGVVLDPDRNVWLLVEDSTVVGIYPTEQAAQAALEGRAA